MMTPLITTLLLGMVAIEQVSSEFDNIKKLALANNKLAFKLQKEFNSQGNSFTSPASIFTSLAMLYQGAEGITAEEMHRVLSFSVAGLKDENINQHFQELLYLLGDSTDEYDLDIANAIMSQYQYPVLNEYKDTLEEYYEAILKEVDFVRENTKAREEINNWVRNKTQGKITKLLESIDSDIVLVLLNAVYFKGTWKTQFSPRNTIEMTFYNHGTNDVSVQMMRTKNTFFCGDFRQHGTEVVKMPYKGDDVSMVVLLPYERNGLSKLEHKLTPSILDDIISNLKKETVYVNFPKFKLEDSKKLKSNLISLGMKSAFANGADFSGISKVGNLKVSKIIHKAVIEVNEEGSEAAGATAILITPLSGHGPRNRHFLVDRPFIFFIRDDRTGMILFYGRVNEL